MTCNWRMATPLRLAGGATALLLYFAPLLLRASDATDDNRAKQVRDVLFLRLWLAFALTLAALCGVVSKPVVLSACGVSAVLYACGSCIRYSANQRYRSARDAFRSCIAARTAPFCSRSYECFTTGRTARQSAVRWASLLGTQQHYGVRIRVRWSAVVCASAAPRALSATVSTRVVRAPQVCGVLKDIR